MAQVSSCWISWNTRRGMFLSHRSGNASVLPVSLFLCLDGCCLLILYHRCLNDEQWNYSKAIQSLALLKVRFGNWSQMRKAKWPGNDASFLDLLISQLCPLLPPGTGREPRGSLHTARSRILRAAHQEEIPACHCLISSTLCCDFVLVQ